MIGAMAAAANRPLALRTLVATAPEREEDRAEQHDPGQLDRQRLVGRAEAGRDRRHEPRCGDEDDRRRARRSAMSIRLMTVETTRQARSFAPLARSPDTIGISADDERARRDQLEDQVRDAERREEGVQVRRDADLVDDHDGGPSPASVPRGTRRTRSGRRGPGRGLTSRSWVATRPGVRLPIGGPQPGRRDVRVDLGRGEALVAEQLLDDPQVRAALEEVGRERVAQGVRRDALGEPGLAAQPVEPVAQAADARAAPPCGSGRPGSAARRRGGPAGAGRAARGVRRRGRRRAPRGRAARAARCAPCGPCRGRGSRRGAGRASRGPRPPAR